jgi:hypothetical protein
MWSIWNASRQWWATPKEFETKHEAQQWWNEFLSTRSWMRNADGTLDIYETKRKHEDGRPA